MFRRTISAGVSVERRLTALGAGAICLSHSQALFGANTMRR
jgi:hypothetical protein